MRRILVFVIVVAVLAVAAVAIATESPVLSPREQLGKSIFFDENLSLNGNQSCASCHDPAAGWTGPHSDVNATVVVYEGSVPGAFGDRKPPSSAYATFAPVLHYQKGGLFVGGNFWDGRATGERLGNPAAEQAQGPFLNPVEQALLTEYDVVSRVVAAAYPVTYSDVFGPVDLGDPDAVLAAYDKIAYAIMSYEASAESNAFTSKFDAVQAGTATFTKEEKKGFNLFSGKAKCGKCHIAKAKKGEPVLFTDFTYDNLGIPKNPDLPIYAVDPDFIDYGLGGFLASRLDYAPFAEENIGKHKVPTLRNVDLRPYEGFVKAYGHNGYFKSLEEIVHFYNTRDVPGEGWMGEPWPAPEVPETVNTAELGNLKLTAEDEAAIVAFMKTLSDGWTP
ncbi:MAG: cytochrome C [Coriobacteriia bacterium]|nr:cytochrome C [Coriobacteriia bacterium]